MNRDKKGRIVLLVLTCWAVFGSFIFPMSSIVSNIYSTVEMKVVNKFREEMSENTLNVNKSSSSDQKSFRLNARRWPTKPTKKSLASHVHCAIYCRVISNVYFFPPPFSLA
jgi:hypothetical protein